MKVILEGETRVPDFGRKVAVQDSGLLTLQMLLELMRPVLMRLAEEDVRPGDVIRVQLERSERP